MSIVFYIVTAVMLFIIGAQDRSNGWTTAALFILGVAWLIAGIVDLIKLKGKKKE